MIIAAGVLGLLSGFIVNYLADVLPFRRRLSSPFCLVCGLEQEWLNYLLWPRSCPRCKTGRSWRSWLVDLVLVIIAVLSWYYPHGKMGFLVGFTVLSYLALVIIIDFEHHLILFSENIFGVILSISIGVWQRGLVSTILGGLAGLGIMYGLYVVGGALMGWVNRKRGMRLSEEALGLGDVLFGAVMGLLLGWPGITAGVILAIFLAGAVSLCYLLFMLATKKYRHDLAIAYGPYLAASCILLLYF